MFYEGFRSGFDDAFNVHYEDNFHFPQHIHRKYEMIVMLEGELIVTINENEYRICAGEALIVFPYQCHSYRNIGRHKTLVFIFSSGPVPFFHRQVEQSYSPYPLFNLNENRVLRMLQDVNRENFDDFEAELKDTFLRRGILYSVLSSFMKQCELKFREYGADTTLLERILIMIEAMPLDQLSLEAIAEELKYEYSYISKYFKQMMGITFTNYINQYRIHVACQMLKNEKCKMIDVAMRVGYNNLRSFNGNFKRITGITPVQFVEGMTPNWVPIGPVIVTD